MKRQKSKRNKKKRELLSGGRIPLLKNSFLKTGSREKKTNYSCTLQTTQQKKMAVKWSPLIWQQRDEKVQQKKKRKKKRRRKRSSKIHFNFIIIIIVLFIPPSVSPQDTWSLNWFFFFVVFFFFFFFASFELRFVTAAFIKTTKTLKVKRSSHKIK